MSTHNEDTIPLEKQHHFNLKSICEHIDLVKTTLDYTINRSENNVKFSWQCGQRTKAMTISNELNMRLDGGEDHFQFDLKENGISPHMIAIYLWQYDIDGIPKEF